MMLNRFFDVLYVGAVPNARYLFIVFMSLISAIIFLLIFKKTSNQRKIKYHKDKIFGNILQMPLYKDKFGMLVLSILNILKHNVLYLKQTLIPLVFICIPLILFTVQINNRCGYKPLAVGQRFIMRVDVDANAIQDSLPTVIENVYCEPSPEIVLETPPLRIETEGNVFWRARVAELPQNGQPYLRIGVQGSDRLIEKAIVTDYGYERFSPAKGKWSFWNGLLNNAEGFLADDAFFEVVSIDYHRASYAFLFWSVDAIILYFLLTLIFALALKPFVKVTI